MKSYELQSTDQELLREWFWLLSVGRFIDQRAPNYLKQAIGWSYHAPYAGHDGIQLAIGQVFERDQDHLFPYYRDMLTVLSAGLTPLEVLRNGLSKGTDGASGGRHMSNHFAKPEWNIHNVSSCTGNHTLHAVGVGRAMLRYAHRGVAICSQGESSLSEGYCYEAINGASTEKLPVLFVIQDNGYGISVPKREQTANEFVADNYRGFKNLTILHCDGKEVMDSMNTLHKARQIVLEEGHPVIVHARCVRIHSHSNSDKHELYRDEKELEEALSQDPYVKFEKDLLMTKRFDQKELDSIREKAKKAVLKAHTEVLEEPDPDPGTILQFVTPPSYTPGPGLEDEDQGRGEKKTMKFIEALNETLKDEFRHNPHTFMWGQDMANKEKGGIFNVSKGMQQEFGPERIFNAPVAEDFIVGGANGFSRFRKDIRVVVEGAEFADYFWPAMEQLVECSHDYWRSNGQFCPNITIRLASGGYIGGGLYHSQNLEGCFTTLPGLRVVVPAFADDAAGLLRTALRSEGVTLYLEPKALYNAKQAQAEVSGGIMVPFGKSRVRLPGERLSVFTYGNTVHLCLQAAHELAGQVEVVDLRSLNPLDEEGILASVSKTNRALVVHEDKVFGGFGGEVVSLITQKAFEFLDAPVKRVGSTFTPVGFHRALERATLPDLERIKKAMEEVLSY